MDKLIANILPNGVILPEISPLSYEFGGMTPLEPEVIIPNGNAIPFLPSFESQAGVYLDSFGCVSQSFENACETYHKAKYGEEPNYSDRDLVVLSGTKPRYGNSGEKVAATAKEKGLIPQELGDWDMKDRNPKMTEELYYSYVRSAKGEEAAKQFKKDHDIITEWVSRDKWADASRCGVLQVYVKAWVLDENGKYINPTGTYNHAVMMADYKTCKIFDTYEPRIKQLDSWESAYPLALKINLIKKNMDKPIIKNNSLVFTTGHGGLFGIYLDGNIIYDDLAKILAMAIMRSELKNEGQSNEYTALIKKTITEAQWDMFPKVNLKGEKLS